MPVLLSAGIHIMKRITSYFKPFTLNEEEVYELIPQRKVSEEYEII